MSSNKFENMSKAQARVQIEKDTRKYLDRGKSIKMGRTRRTKAERIKGKVHVPAPGAISIEDYVRESKSRSGASNGAVTFASCEQSQKRVNRADGTDCGIKAVAIATNKPYSLIYRLAKQCGYKENRGMSHSCQRALFGLLGIPTSRVIDGVKHAYAGVWDYLPRGQRMTIPTFAKTVGKVGTWLVYSYRHMTCIKDGVVEDWTANRRKQVQWYVRVS